MPTAGLCNAERKADHSGPAQWPTTATCWTSISCAQGHPRRPHKQWQTRLRAAVALASWCALRGRGELLELRRAEIDLEAAVVRVRGTAGVVNGQWIIGPPKSKEGSRDVAIAPHLIPMITDHLANHVGPEQDAHPSTLGRASTTPNYCGCASSRRCCACDSGRS
jgi:integrase